MPEFPVLAGAGLVKLECIYPVKADLDAYRMNDIACTARHGIEAKDLDWVQEPQDVTFDHTGLARGAPLIGVGLENSQE
jgi:hypothetical protein